MKLNEDIIKKIFDLKKIMGFEEQSWEHWINHIQNSFSNSSTEKDQLENIMEKIHYEKSYQSWIFNFSHNLENIWKESSAKDLKISTDNTTQNSAVIIGAGPSLKKNKHLELLANTDFRGSVICTDRILKSALESGVNPDKFPNFYVITIDGVESIKNFYEHEIISKFAKKIKGIFTTIVHPNTVYAAREKGIQIHWLHPLFDHSEGKKSFNQISGLIVRAKRNGQGLPAIQTGGNVGTSAWFVAWRLLHCSRIALIGIDHSWNEDEPIQSLLKHSNIPNEIRNDPNLLKKFFPKIYNPDFNCTCVLDPIFQFYSNALKEFIRRSPPWLETINATEGGCIFGDRIKCMSFERFLQLCRL